jgi:hypothetical protein
MKKLLTAIVIFGMAIMPFAVYAQSDQEATQAPPVAPALVREGDFAMKLVDALKIGTATNEADAETMLGSSGIAPKNGWIADYPVTPDIIGELQNAVGAAADSNKLPMGKDEALKVLQSVSGEFGLSVLPDTSGKYSENQPPTSPEYVQPSVIDNYYYDEGPPVVTYYPPPWDYYYLYAWVPYPFWCSGFFFPGFFVLNDFSVVVFGGHHHHHHLVTNHFVDPKTHAVVSVNPRTRATGTTAHTSLTRTETFRSPEARKAATSIFNRSFSRTETARGPEGISSRGRGTTNRVDNVGRQNEMNLRQGQGRSFNPPNVTHERSFHTPSMGSRSSGFSESSGRTFSAPRRSFGSPSAGSRGSFGGFHANGAGHSFGHGGFSGGFSHGGGCRGRC